MQCPCAERSPALVLFVLSLGLVFSYAESDRGAVERDSLSTEGRALRSSLLLNGRQANHKDASHDPGRIQEVVRQLQDTAWQAAQTASVSRAAVANLRAKHARITAEQSAEVAANNNRIAMTLPASIKSAEAKAELSLSQALKYEGVVKGIAADVVKKTYAAARKKADEEVAKLESEATKYYEMLEAKQRALANNDKKGAADAASEAAQPYVDVQLRAAAAVQIYNQKAIDLINLGKNMVKTAFRYAKLAQMEQANGKGVEAQQHMIQAHMLMGGAKAKRADAYKIRQLAESLNMSLPAYSKAAQMASIHALATFSGLQLDAKAKAPDVKQQAEEISQQAARGLDELTRELERAEHELPGPSP